MPNAQPPRHFGALGKQALWRDRRPRRCIARRGGGRVRDAARAVGLRQDDAAQHHRRVHRAGQRGRCTSATEDVHACAAAPARHRHRVSELRAVPAHERRRQRRLSAEGAADRREAEMRTAGRMGALAGQARRLRQPPHRPALRRPAAARRARPRHRVPAEAHPDGRAALGARQAAARAHADRDPRAARAARARPRSTSRTTSARR